jgi:hypothetical protein
VCLSKNPGWNEYQKVQEKRAELSNETTNPFHHSSSSLYMFSYRIDLYTYRDVSLVKCTQFKNSRLVYMCFEGEVIVLIRCEWIA